MWRSRITWGLWLLMVLILYMFINNTGTRVVLAGSILIPALSVITAILSARGTTVSAEMDSDPGGIAKAGLDISNCSILPVYSMHLNIVIQNHFAGTSVNESLVLSVPGRSDTVRSFDRIIRYCGSYSIDIKESYITDVWRLIRIPVKNPVSSISDDAPSGLRFTVLPHRFPIEVRLAESNTESLSDERYSSEKAGDDTTEIFSIRDYVPGDPIRYIHWKQSARNDRLLIREPGLPIADNVLIMFDMAFPQDNTPDERRTHTAASVLASLSGSLLDSRISHTVVWNNIADDTLVRHEVSGPQDSDTVLSDLMSCSFGSCASMLCEKFTATYGQCRFAHIIIITTRLSSEYMLMRGPGRLTLLVYDDSSKPTENLSPDMSIIPFAYGTENSELSSLIL